MKLNLQLFSGTLTVTVYKDGNITTASASPNSSLAKNDQVTLTITPDTGKELKEIEVIAGGVTIDMETKKFTMGEADVVLYVKGQANNLYKITEETVVNINGTKQTLKRNMLFEYAPNGAMTGVACNGTAVTISDASVKQALIDSGVLVKI